MLSIVVGSFGLLTAGILAIVFQGLIFPDPPFRMTGWLVKEWERLGEGRGDVLGQIIFVFGAAWAAILAPMVFRGQVTSLKEAHEDAIRELKASNASIMEELQKSAEQARSSLGVLQSYAIQNMGIKEQYTFDDLPRAKAILEELQSLAAILCQSIVQFAPNSEQISDHFRGKWPGYRPYIQQLRDLGLIAEADAEKFFAIADSRKFTRETNPEHATIGDLNLLGTRAQELRTRFEKARS